MLWCPEGAQKPSKTSTYLQIAPSITSTTSAFIHPPTITSELARLAAMLQLASCRGAIFRRAAPTTLRPDTIVSKISCFGISIWPFDLLRCVKSGRVGGSPTFPAFATRPAEGRCGAGAGDVSGIYWQRPDSERRFNGFSFNNNEEMAARRRHNRLAILIRRMQFSARHLMPPSPQSN